MLPPELSELERRYTELLQRVDAGTLDFNAALDTLGHLTCHDADGYQWGISPDGEPPHTIFLRGEPSGVPEPASPELFAVSRDISTPPAWATTAPQFTDQNIDPPQDQYQSLPGQTHQQPYPQPSQGSDGQRVDWTESGHQTPRRESALTRASASGSSFASVVSKILRPNGGRSDTARRGPDRRMVIAVAAAILAVLAAAVFMRDDSKQAAPTTTAPAPAANTAASCPALTADVVGVSGETKELLGCLDGNADPSSTGYGPQIARLGVVVAADKTISFDPAKPMTKGDVVSTALAMYRFAGGEPPTTSTPADLSSVPEASRADTQTAIDLGFITPAELNLTAAATTADLTAVLGSILAGSRGDNPTAVSSAADAATASAKASIAQAYLASAGVVPTGTAAYGFANALTAQTWVDLTGRTVIALRSPEAVQQQTPTTALAARPAELNGESVDKMVSAVSSGRVDVAAGVVSGADAASPATILAVAQLAGLDATGLVLVAGKPSVDGDKASTKLTVTVADTGREVATGTADWVREAGTWKLAEFPTLTATR
jgi:hypothetical protein